MNFQKIRYLLFSSLILTACIDTNNNEKDLEIKELSKQESNNKTFTLTRDTVISEVRLPGELQPFREVDLYAKMSSYVKSLHVDIGTRVKAGQLLLQLEAPEINSQLSAARSNLHSREAIYTASYSIYQRLLETSKVEGTISKNDLEQALAKKNTDHAQLQAANATYQEVRTIQTYLQIKAPFDGVVTSRNVNIGAIVGQAAQTPVLSIQDQRKLRLVVSIPGSYSNYLKVGDQLSFQVGSQKGETFTAKVSRTSGALDKTLRSLRIELDVLNTGNKLLPGMVANVTIPLKNSVPPLVIAKSAVVTTQRGNFVIKVVDNKAQYVMVELGLEAADQVEVFSDLLKENDVLLMKANEEIVDGARID